MNIFLDIETIPTARQDVRDFIAATVTPPAQMKKAETIAAWEANDKPAAVQEAIAKTGLDGAFGRVCAVGFGVDDGIVEVVHAADDEEGVLRELAARLDRAVKVTDQFRCVVVGHNVSSFDLRFLTQRYIVNGIRPPLVIARAAQAKPWESEKVFDTMIQWAGVGNRIALDRLCLALGIPSPKGEIDGSKVAEYVAAGRIAEVAEYCRRDVESVREVWRRMTFAFIEKEAA